MSTSCLCLVSLVTRFQVSYHITTFYATSTLTTPTSPGAAPVCTLLLFCLPTEHAVYDSQGQRDKGVDRLNVSEKCGMERSARHSAPVLRLARVRGGAARMTGRRQVRTLAVKTTAFQLPPMSGTRGPNEWSQLMW
ncbi:hypothetical protein E2C01_045639 [Portunus trituberculatus]|uniref:Uncharacterized protein n=1 Tax=Portunus trituberculatus TaxID=210409 RepID=A0A5B7G302_PORTR|nr:hypothetical protein [Portunus trituberculatus]